MASTDVKIPKNWKTYTEVGKAQNLPVGSEYGLPQKPEVCVLAKVRIRHTPNAHQSCW